MTDHSIIAEQNDSTVVAQWEKVKLSNTAYQSEAELEKSFIKQLQNQGYEYLTIHTEKQLLDNLRLCLQQLNDQIYTDQEWEQILAEITSSQLRMEDKCAKIQQDPTLSFTRKDGTTFNVHLINKASNIFKNKLQVINQYENLTGVHKNRYDVTILVNGLPLIHIELKARGVSIKEAFNQINRYQRDSFWSGCGLYDYVQIFVISNGAETKYYSNTTRYAHVQELKQGQKSVIKKKKNESNSFEFTSYWSDQKNNLLPELADFTQTFFAKHTILRILTRYCVFNTDQQLLVMRPYQIAATEKILLRIETALNNHWQGSIRAGGFIWHTTGSGKTLTSFKTAQLAKDIEGVNKVLFIVDRKDLDYQTMKEYDRFEKGCANSNSNCYILRRQLLDPKCRIIITTIQKLSSLLKVSTKDNISEQSKQQQAQLDEVLRKENFVLIFDECHRSQFGDMHALIVKRFKRYMLFGFTGTPIFPVAGTTSGIGHVKTTAEAFGGEPDEQGKPTRALHTYTIINAIRDKNVLKFHVDYERTMKMKEGVDNKEVWAIDKEEALHASKRIEIITDYIIHHFGQKTKQQADIYGMSQLTNVEDVVKKGKKVKESKQKVLTRGFNSIFAVDSVKAAILYYNEFKKQLALPGAPALTIATIFTFAANEEEDPMGTLDDENPESTDKLDLQSRDALDSAIDDYNQRFGTSYSTDGESFQNYYKDVSLRMKNKEIDILIVVGMFLTGFDAKTLNTLWVDKNLKLHGLLQAYSRTNRILNAVKDCGNIVCFRNLEDATNKALAIFGDEGAGGIVLMRTFKEYYEGYTDKDGKQYPGYEELVKLLQDKFDIGSFLDITDDDLKKEFIRLFGTILKMRNLLSTFDEFTPDKQLITPFDMQQYTSWYLSLRDEMRGKGGGSVEKENINDDIEFEIELVKQVQVDIAYILMLVNKYHESNCVDKEIVIKIIKSIEASPDLRDKKELIQKFIDQMTPDPSGNVIDDWEHYVAESRKRDLDAIISEENLKPDETYRFIDDSFEQGEITTTGVGITRILPPMPVIGGMGKREAKKQTVIQKLQSFLKKYLGISSSIEMAEPEPEQLPTLDLSEQQAPVIPFNNMLKEDDSTNLMAADDGESELRLP
ncbi:MAG: type I restriction endonuclease subunit R [Bacteroidales bacterium]|nr:type I restriction endonuclease subunit R [Bacteroidales bacterium]